MNTPLPTANPQYKLHEIADWNLVDCVETIKYHTITQDQYQEFQLYYIIDVLKGKRYGQAFCDRFNIPQGTPLYFFNSQNICDRWIRDNYLVKDETEVH